MTRDIETKMYPVVLVSGAGTALGTSSIIDTSGWQTVQLMNIHGGTGGSRTIGVYVNAGSQWGTAATTLPNATFVGSGNSDQAGAGSLVWHCGSLTHQAVVSYGTSTNGLFSISYMLYE